MAKRDKDTGKVPAKTAERTQALAPESGSAKPMTRGTFEHPLARLRAEMDSLFDRFFTGWPTFANWGANFENPRGLDVEENQKEILIRAEAPGFEPNDFDVHVSGNMLTIKAEHKEEESKTDEGFRYSERSFSSFQRSVPLSTPVDGDKVDAHYRNGVLELRLPRTENVEKRRIAVKT
jgi:HSP20 family protein